MTPQSFSATLCPAAFRLAMGEVGKNPESTLIRLRKFWNQLRKVGPSSIVPSRSRPELRILSQCIAIVAKLFLEINASCRSAHAMQKKKKLNEIKCRSNTAGDSDSR